MISDMASDLKDKISTVTFESVLYTVGAVVEDRKVIPLPACRIVYMGDHEYEDSSALTPRLNESGIVPSSQQMLSTFSALIILPWESDADVIDTEFPLLEQVQRAVHGKEGPSGHRWRYIGQSKALVMVDRIGYEQRFTLNWVL